MGIHVSYAALTEIIPAEYVINVLANTYTRVKMIREGGVITPQSITCGGNPHRRIFRQWKSDIENNPPT